MEFEWDDEKAILNASKHGVTFQEAQTVFDDPLMVEFFDIDHSESERRYLRMGMSTQGRILVVSYTERNGKIRLISARETTRRERNAYENGTN